MCFWAKCFNPNVLSQLFISDRGLRMGHSVLRGKDQTADPAGKPANPDPTEKLRYARP